MTLLKVRSPIYFCLGLYVASIDGGCVGESEAERVTVTGGYGGADSQTPIPRNSRIRTYISGQ